ncbi:MAG: TolC family protein [Desulfobacterales bacterium]|jgi:outer membrane protein TolC|nr:TolC family protein [Desulfobacterales bacterium]
MTTHHKRINLKWVSALLILLLLPSAGAAQNSKEALELRDAIESALKANLGIKRSQEEIHAAEAVRHSSITRFLPTLGTSYSYIHRNEEKTSPSLLTGRDIVTSPRDQYTFTTLFTQPIFTGFGLINEYRLAELGLDRAEVSAKLTRQNVILDAKNAFFSVLKNQKLLDVAHQTVTSIASQKEVSENFYKVGLSPLNDLLQSQVQLANAKQQLTSAQNNLEIARTQFNTVLRRPVNTPVLLVDELDYSSFQESLDSCLDTAQKNRLEVQVAELDIEVAEKQVKLTEKDYFPSVNLTGAYARTGDDWDAHGGEGISDSAGWNVQATASWDFWQWGRTGYGRKEKLARLSQSKYRKAEVLDSINLEVKQAYLRTKEAEQNIVTIEKAVEQAKENLRITEEQYKEQVATQTDVLIAQTLLTQTMTNYYNALYDFKIAHAVLLRALGREAFE